MGFDGLASQIITFIAVISVSMVIILNFNTQIESTSNAATTKQYYLSQQLKTEITIEAASYTLATEQLVAFIKNTGSTQLKPEDLSVYIDELYIPNSTDRSLVLVSDTNTVNVNIWDPQEILQATINITLDTSQTHELKLVTPYQNSDTFEFSIN